MVLFFHELKRNRLTLAIWTAVIAFMLSLCVLIYPEMSSQMGDISAVFADMGSFSAAFGMDQINFGEFKGFFAVECGNVLGIGGAFFAAITAVTALAKEEKEKTAEFLLAHPISRAHIITAKLCSVYAQIAIMNAVVLAITVLSTIAVGEGEAFFVIGLMFLAYFLLQIEIASVSFGISAFIRTGGIGIGLGLAVTMYFLNIVANLTKKAEFLKFITPFGYTDGAEIISSNTLDIAYLSVGMIFALAGIIAAYCKYIKKDIF